MTKWTLFGSCIKSNIPEGETSLKYFICVIGMVLVIEGLPYFAFPSRMKAFLVKLPEIPDDRLRVYGIAAITAGLVLVYFGTR